MNTRLLVVVVIYERMVNKLICPIIISDFDIEKPDELFCFPFRIEKTMREVAPLKHGSYNFGVKIVPRVLRGHHSKDCDYVLTLREKTHCSTVEHIEQLPLVRPFYRQQGANILRTKLLEIA